MPITSTPPNSEDLSKHLNSMTVVAREGRRCIDGRYEAHQSTGMIARPGGDLGYVMGLLGLSNKNGWELSATQAFEAIYRAVQKRGGFYFHSDHPSESSNDGEVHFGCAHVAKSLDPEIAPKYDLDPAQVRELIEYARFKSSLENDVHMSCLNGEHREEALLILRGTEAALQSSDLELTHMYFVYEQDRDEAFSYWLVNELKESLPQLSDNNFKAELKIQLNATVEALAKDKEQIEVWAQNPSSAIEFELSKAA